MNTASVYKVCTNKRTRGIVRVVSDANVSDANVHKESCDVSMMCANERE